MKKIIILLSLLFFYNKAQDSEFLITNNINNLNNSNSENSDDLLIQEFGDLLELDAELSQISVNLRKFSLDQIKKQFNSDNNIKNIKLNNKLQELKSLNKFMKNIIKEIKNKFLKLRKFRI
jgi:hypothetical protein